MDCFLFFFCWYTDSDRSCHLEANSQMAKRPLIVIIHFLWHRMRITNRALLFVRAYGLQLHITTSSAQHWRCTTSAVGRKKWRKKSNGNRQQDIEWKMHGFCFRYQSTRTTYDTTIRTSYYCYSCYECTYCGNARMPYAWPYARRTCSMGHSTQSHSTAQVEGAGEMEQKMYTNK